MFGLPSQVLTEAYLRKTENGSSPGEGRSSTEHTPAANSEAPKEKWLVPAFPHARIDPLCI